MINRIKVIFIRWNITVITEYFLILWSTFHSVLIIPNVTPLLIEVVN